MQDVWLQSKVILEPPLSKTTSSSPHVTADYVPENIVEENSELYESSFGIISSIIEDMIHLSLKKILKKALPKKGLPRKRQMFDVPYREGKKQKELTKASRSGVQGKCSSNTCPFKCPNKISEEQQTNINSQYWKLSKKEQHLFVNGCIKQISKIRNITNTESRRQNTYRYYLKSSDGIDTIVCKTFFLATLGYNKNNDRFLKTVRNDAKKTISPGIEKRGHRPALNKISRNPIVSHIKSFRPTASHYRREHAPRRLYLPSDVNITFMFNDFKMKHPDFICSYELYRQEVKKMNISFAQLGGEECFTCSAFEVHKNDSGHEYEITSLECDSCQKYYEHKTKYRNAREEYLKDSGKPEIENEMIISADLQKVIMLPRAEMFKEIIFIPRIIVFNESFVPVGKAKCTKPLAVLWHEGVAKRNKEEIISAFYAFFRKNRDVEHITIWLDNSSAQNKNWALFSFFVYIVNCSEVNLKQLTIKYFEPGHSYMSADHFHQKVEMSMKRAKKIFDFDDFLPMAVKLTLWTLGSSTTGNDLSSKFKLKKSNFYFKELVLAIFSRNNFNFKYKTAFEHEEYKVLDFLNNKATKNGAEKPTARIRNRGVDESRKNVIISTLKPIISETRLQFWKDLSLICEAYEGDSDE
nr:unnamed protein product [Callosobruchus analis]